MTTLEAGAQRVGAAAKQGAQSVGSAVKKIPGAQRVERTFNRWFSSGEIKASATAEQRAPIIGYTAATDLLTLGSDGELYVRGSDIPISAHHWPAAEAPTGSRIQASARHWAAEAPTDDGSV